MYRSASFKRDVAGFMLIEVLVALSIVAVSLVAIGSLVATTVRGTRSLDQHLALIETARMIETGLPGRNDLTIGTISGAIAAHRWRVDVLPFPNNFVDPQAATRWVPQTVVIRVEAPSGQLFQINTIRLRRRTNG